MALTPDERHWLDTNRSRIVLAVETNYPPFSFIDQQGRASGLAADYIRLIEAKIGARFPEQRHDSLNTIFAKARSGEVGIVNAVTKTPERMQFLAFTDPFIAVPNVILVRKERAGTLREQDLAGLKVSLVKSYAITEHLTRQVNGLVVDSVPDDITALLNLSFGRSDAAVIDLATASYLISQKGITNLRVAGETRLNIQLAIGTPIHEPVLHAILQKGLAAITDAEREAIHNRWINASGRNVFADPRLQIAVLGGLLAILAAVVTITIWNRTLRRQVRQRTADLEEERRRLEERVETRTAELARREAQLRATLEQSPNVAVQWYDEAGRVVYWNHASEILYGWSAAEALGKTLDQLIHTAEETAAFLVSLKEIGRTGDKVGPLEYATHNRAGETRWVMATIFAIPSEAADKLLFVCMDVDVTERKQLEIDLRGRERYIRAVFDNFPFMVWLKDRESRFLVVNQTLAKIANLTSPEQVVGKSDLDFWPPEQAERFRADDRAVLESGQPKTVEEEISEPGRSYWLETYKSPVELDGQVIGTVGFARDISDRKRVEESLRQAASVFEHAREGIMIADPAGIILDVNQAFTRITGYERAEALGKPVKLLKSGHHDADFYRAMWRDLLEKQQWFGETWNRRKNGEIFATLQTISAVCDEQGRTLRYVSLFSDITAIKDHQAQLEHMAHYDVLTGLPNRVLLADRLHQAMPQAQRNGNLLAVVYLDLDGFKKINDTHGHEVGDDMLIAAARRMRQALRDGDTLARLGGDEFVAVLIGLAENTDSQPVLDRLLAAVSEPIHICGLDLSVSASLGVTFFPQDEAVDADQLIRQGDQAMYQAKQAGRNRYHLFDAEHDRTVRGHHESLQRIRNALENREFVLYYQPKVNLRTGATIGVEALIRWQHPERGLLPPALFLPVIEDHPIALDVGAWVIDTALRQIEAWRQAGLAIPVSVNIDALQLQQTDFIDHLRLHLAAHPGVQPGDLELEVLETSALEDIANVSRLIKQCHALGVTFALDDFGTGYSSLTYLKRLPAGLLKIDQSFVREMLDDPDNLTIIEGILSLASAFRRNAIAEGVETLAHGEMLIRLGCEFGQGYEIARPMPAEAIPAWLASWQSPLSWQQLAPLGKDKLPLLYGLVQHQVWIEQIVGYLDGTRTEATCVELLECRYCDWHKDVGMALFGAQPAFRIVDDTHRTIHNKTLSLVERRRNGLDDEARAGIGELRRLGDRLQAALMSLQ